MAKTSESPLFPTRRGREYFERGLIVGYTLKQLKYDLITCLRIYLYMYAPFHLSRNMSYEIKARQVDMIYGSRSLVMWFSTTHKILNYASVIK